MFGQAPIQGLGTRAVGSTLAALLLASPLVAQSVFNQIPAFSSACYIEQDTGADALERLKVTLQEQINAGEENNAALSQFDLMEQQQRLIAVMQANPQRAMEVMQLTQTLPIEDNQFLMASVERENADNARMDALREEYREALATRTGPIDARISQFGPGADLPANYMEQLAELANRWDAEYAVICGEWYGPDGRFGQFMGELRTYLLDEWVPEVKRLTDAKNQIVEFFGGVTSTRYVFIGEQEAAVRYIETAQTLLGQREAATRRQTRGGI